jgi:epoxyqueuosine reductase
MNFETRLKERAQALGFNLVGLTPAAPSPTLNAYFRWIEAGYHGEMAYLAREDRVARRRDLNVILPGARSLVMVGLDYAAFNIPPEVLRDPLRGRISNYAWGGDYHALMTPRLEALAAWIAEDSRVYVDTGAILERSHAQAAGLGFVGKNTLLIHPRRGSYFFLGTILTTREFDEYDQPSPATLCGGCTRCLRACPTNAFPAPHVLDARRCISYLSIEYKGDIPEDLRPQMGNWVYGCDICQEVCPFVRRFTHETTEDIFRTFDLDRAAPPLRDLLTMTPESFAARFAESPIKRIGHARLLRNTCIAAGNSGAREFVPMLEKIAMGEEPLSAEHARWALNRLA